MKIADRRGVASILFLILFLALTACNSDDDCDEQYPPAPIPSGGNNEEQCLFLAESNVAWPIFLGLKAGWSDKYAVYWGSPYELNPGEKLILKGKLPAARYVSFTTYGAAGNAIPTADTIYDTLIIPDPGTTDRYTITIDPSAIPNQEGDNVLAAFPAEFLGNVGTVYFRQYVSTDKDFDPYKDWADILPEMTLVFADGASRVLSKVVPVEVGTATATIDPIPDQANPGFYRYNFEGSITNPASAYLATTASWQPQRILVITGKSPTFPDTRHGESIFTPAQLRYWSLGIYENVPYGPLIDEVADMDALLDNQGYYTIVMSAEEDRPKNATAKNGINWLPWGPLENPESTYALVIRQTLPADDFTQATRNVIPYPSTPEDTAAVMGEYYPEAYFTTKSEFEAEFEAGN